MEKFLKMPRDSTVKPCCPTHMPKYCVGVGDSVNVKDVDAFERIITHARFSTEKYQQDTPEANKALRAFLVAKLKEGRKITNSSFDWNYTVVVPEYRDPIPVCMKAFAAVYGIKMSTLKDVQRHIRDDEVPSHTAPGEQKMTMEEAFGAWGMDIGFYHSNIANFCDFNAVPETEASMVAAAYLSDFFDLASESQPTGI